MAEEPDKQRDLIIIIRNIQINASIHALAAGETHFQYINRRTFDQRAANSIPTIELALDAYHRHDPFVIGDVAVADGTSALELAQHFEGHNVQIVAYDQSLFYDRYELPDHSILYFDSKGTIVQYIHDGLPYLRDQLDEDFAQGMETTWKQGEFNSSHREKISLLNPEAEAYARQHPNRLRFEAQDIFQPIARRHHFIRVLGLLMRGEYSYFNDETIKKGLQQLARSLENGGQLMNGTFWEEGEGDFDLFQREGDHLRHRAFHTYRVQDGKMVHHQDTDEATTTGWAALPIPAIYLRIRQLSSFWNGAAFLTLLGLRILLPIIPLALFWHWFHPAWGGWLGKLFASSMIMVVLQILPTNSLMWTMGWSQRKAEEAIRHLQAGDEEKLTKAANAILEKLRVETRDDPLLQKSLGKIRGCRWSEDSSMSKGTARAQILNGSILRRTWCQTRPICDGSLCDEPLGRISTGKWPPIIEHAELFTNPATGTTKKIWNISFGELMRLLRPSSASICFPYYSRCIF